MASFCSAWWPGGRTMAKPFLIMPRLTASTSASVLPADSRADSDECALK